jgi:hypothetical protein
MVGAKQLVTLVFILVPAGAVRPSGVCSGHYIALHRCACRGGLQAWRERRPGLQVPEVLIEANANIVVKIPSVWNPWLGYSSPFRWHKSTLTVASKPTQVAQADFGRNLKPALAAKLFVFSVFHSLWLSGKFFLFFASKSTLCGAKSTIVVASKVRFTRSHGNLKSTSKVAYQSPLCAATKVDFGFQVASQSPPRAATKVDFGFKVAFQSPLRTAQSRLRFSSRILKSALTARLLLKLHGSMPNYYLETLQLGGCTQITTRKITLAGFAHSQARGLRTNNYSTWLIRLSYLGGYTLQEYSGDGFREH